MTSLFPAMLNPMFRRTLLVSLAAHALILTLMIEHLPVIGSKPAGSPSSMRATLAGKATDHKTVSHNMPAKKAGSTLPAALARQSSLQPLPSRMHDPSSSSAQVAASLESVKNLTLPEGAVSGAASGGAAKAVGDDIESGPAAEELRTYRLALGREARRLKLEFDRKYSRLAAGLEGRVEMNIRTGYGETVIQLTRSSGHSELDEQALELIGRAVRQTALPDALHGHRFMLPVALEFQAVRQ